MGKTTTRRIVLLRTDFKTLILASYIHTVHMYHGVYESDKPQALSNTLADLCVSPAFMLELCDNSDKSDKNILSLL